MQWTAVDRKMSGENPKSPTLIALARLLHKLFIRT